jgi:shikimate kinase
VALVGLPGAGKSSVAPLLAARLGARWDDLDALVEREAGRSVPELLREAGETAFRVRERQALEHALAAATGAMAATGAARAPLVVACGGGAVTDDATRGLLAASATVVWLTVRAESALARLGAGGVATRPLLAGAEGALARLKALGAAREPLYAGLAAVTVTTDDRTLDEVADAVAAALRERWASSES